MQLLTLTCSKNTHHILANQAAMHGCEYPKYEDPIENTEQFIKEKESMMLETFLSLQGGLHG